MDRLELYKKISELKTEMTPDERMQKYLQGEEVDCVPYGLLAPDDAMAHIWGYTRGDMMRSFDLRCEIIRRKKEQYGFSGLSASMGLRGIAEVAGSVMFYPEESSDYVQEYCMQTYDSLGSIDPFSLMHGSDLVKRKLDEISKIKEIFPEMGVSTDVAGPISTAIAMRPVEKVLRDVRKEPEKLHLLLDYSVECSLEWVKMFCEQMGECSVGISDPVTTTDILGMKYFKEFSKPYLTKLFKGIKIISGNNPSLHICGHTKKIWNDLMEIGVDNFSLDNCEDMREAKEVMGERVFLSGNIAPVQVMRNGTIDDVIEAVKEVLEKSADNPCGHMLMTGCQLPIGTSQENIDAFIYAAKTYGRDARMGRMPKGME